MQQHVQRHDMVNTVLQQAAYTNTTITLYRKAVHAFLDWTAHHYLNISTIPQLDVILNNYIVHLWSTGVGKATADKTVYGIIMYIAEADR